MARPSSKAAKKRDPRKSEEWPVGEFPYVVHKPHEEHPRYCRTWKEAVNGEIKKLERHQDQFKLLDSEVVERCEQAIQALKKLTPEETGGVRLMIDRFYQTWYQADIVKRTPVT